MDIVKPGVEYKATDFADNKKFQTIKFTEKVDGKFQAGTTNEEIINILIDRFYSLQKKNFSAENQCIILLLKNVRQLVAKRLSRKIEKVIKYNESTDTNKQ
jgi:hypothetical protein